MYLNPEQAAYIDQLRADGSKISVDVLRARLSEGGWPDYEVEEAIGRYTESVEEDTPPSVEVPPPPSDAALVEASQTTESREPISEPVSQKKPLLILAGAGGLVLVLLGTLYAFMTQNFFSNHETLTNETLLSTIYSRISDIETTNYQFDLKLAVTDREVGAISYSEMFPLDEAELNRYRRDQDRLRDIAKIKSELDKLKPSFSYNKDPGAKDSVVQYPVKLADIGLNVSDPSSGPYTYIPSADLESYSLVVTLETDEAYNVLRYSNYYGQSTSGEGRTVTITPDSYVSIYGFTGRPAQPKLFGVFDLSDMEEFLPKDISAAFKFGGSVDTNTDKPANAKLSVGGEVTFGDANFAFDAEGRKIDTNFYAVLNKVPTFFGSLSQLRGTWVAFNEMDLRNYGYGNFYDYYVPSDENERKQRMKEAGGWFMKILEIAERLQVVKISTGPELDETYGEGFTRYTLKFDKNRIHDFATEVIALLDGTDYEWSEKDRAEMLSYLEGEEFDMSFDYLSNNVTFSVWFDDKGYPTRVEQHVRYVPSPNALALKDSQIEIVYSLTLSDINKTLRLEVPQDAISFDELMVQITGKSLEEIMISRQESNLRAIKSALTSYYEWSGQYPATLEELKKKRNEVEKKVVATSSNPYAYSNSYYDDKPFIKSLPSDVFAKESYGYTPLGDDFSLTYQIKQEQYTTDKNPVDYYRNSTGVYQNPLFYPATATKPENLLTRRYVEGKNTMTKTKMSVEAEGDRVDTDEDDIADSLEDVLGTDKVKADTDGDGYSDFEEIMSGSNPLGPGKLDYKRSSSLFF